MRAPLSWIRDFTPLDAPPGEIAHALDHLGLEVEAVHEPGREILGVVVARALDVRPHPDADRLSLVDVHDGSRQVTVVCGAPNVEAGMTVAWAPPGAELPGAFRLDRRRIRGEVSEGMLCSARELGLGDDHTGILALDPSSAPGADVREVLGLDDVVFELSITPNRPDAMSIVGVARELAAAFGRPFTAPTPDVAAGGSASAASVSVEVHDASRCPRFTARRIDVAVEPSPPWLAQRLTLAGMRPISNVVDVTNYVLLERGQPLHAFDAARLAGPGLVVRLAGPDERITTLDAVERVLTREDLLVCDAAGAPQALAGIMGGADGEVRTDTVSVVLEAAYFTPLGIAKTSKRLGLRSESSARFERGVDPDAVLAGSDRAVELLRQVASGVAAPAVDVYPTPVPRARISVRVPRVEALLGVTLDVDAVRGALEPIGIDAETPEGAEPGTLVAVAPTFRPDLTREIDIVEEVARRIGLDRIARTLPSTTAQGGGLTRRQRERRLVADVMVGLGASEAMTIPMLSPDALSAVGLPDDGWVRATNSLRADEPILRPALLPGLLLAAAHNLGHGVGDVALFELGRVFLPPIAGALLPDERDHLGVLLTGSVARTPLEADRPVDAFDAVDAVRAIAAALELADLRLVPRDSEGLVPGRAGAILVDGAEVGVVGEVDPAALHTLGAPGPAAALELWLDPIWASARRDRAFRAPSRYPAATVDLAFVVREDVDAASIERTLRDAGGPLVEAVRLFDEFRSAALGADRRSLAFALRFRAADRTLTDAEVATVRQACIDAVIGEHAAELRG